MQLIKKRKTTYFENIKKMYLLMDPLSIHFGNKKTTFCDVIIKLFGKCVICHRCKNGEKKVAILLP